MPGNMAYAQESVEDEAGYQPGRPRTGLPSENAARPLPYGSDDAPGGCPEIPIAPSKNVLPVAWRLVSHGARSRQDRHEEPPIHEPATSKSVGMNAFRDKVESGTTKHAAQRIGDEVPEVRDLKPRIREEIWDLDVQHAIGRQPVPKVPKRVHGRRQVFQHMREHDHVERC